MGLDSCVASLTTKVLYLILALREANQTYIDVVPSISFQTFFVQAFKIVVHS